MDLSFWPRLQNLDHLSACTLSHVRGEGYVALEGVFEVEVLNCTSGADLALTLEMLSLL
uniref:Uncharacterized protein n=1 Tax=Anguilla anguilla TaxID=7936 RepID=A0A0E9TDJ5_ANGAN